MTDQTPTEKQLLRREKLQARRDLAPDYRKSADLSIRARVETLPEFRQAKTVAAYAGDGTEPDLIPLLRKARAEGKTICFPRWREEDSQYEMAVADEAFTLVEGKWKMPEPPRDAPSMPQDMLRKALWLVPVADDIDHVLPATLFGSFDLLFTIHTPRLTKSRASRHRGTSRFLPSFRRSAERMTPNTGLVKL